MLQISFPFPILQTLRKKIKIFNTLILYKMKALVEKINAEIAAFQVNADAQVVKGNKAAGARARKAALELINDLKEFRKVSVAEAKK